MEVYERHEKFLKNPFGPRLNSVIKMPDNRGPGLMDSSHPDSTSNSELFDWYKGTIASYHDRKPEILRFAEEPLKEDDMVSLPEQHFTDKPLQKCFDIRKCDLKTMITSSNLKLVYENGPYRVVQKSAENHQPFDSIDRQIDLQFLNKWLDQEGGRLDLALGLYDDKENNFDSNQSWKNKTTENWEDYNVNSKGLVSL